MQSKVFEKKIYFKAFAGKRELGRRVLRITYLVMKIYLAECASE